MMLEQESSTTLPPATAPARGPGDQEAAAGAGAPVQPWFAMFVIVALSFPAWLCVAPIPGVFV